jgi:hypothetical protein
LKNKKNSNRINTIDKEIISWRGINKITTSKLIDAILKNGILFGYTSKTDGSSLSSCCGDIPMHKFTTNEELLKK